MTHYLTDGRLEIDNNLTEQQIKPFVIIRKNFLFAASIPGAKALCAHMSLIRTAIAHKIEPFAYIQAALERLPHSQVLEDIEKLLPWNFN